jgi:hypothetical protein
MEFILKIEQYNSLNYPPAGKHIMAQTQGDTIVVYQAYKKTIADYAIQHQKLGGPDFSFNRMSWIKPNFLWMMYRSGWGTKEGQERILAIWIKQRFFDAILEESVISSFDKSIYMEKDSWKSDLDSKEVRLQWDPDHDPYGAPMERRGLQLGLKGSILKKYATESIIAIQDLTAFSTEQYAHIQNKTLNDLMVPLERIYKPASSSIVKKIGID